MFRGLTALLAAVLSSCTPQRPFSGGFEYRNRTGEEIYIVSLSGFENAQAAQGPGRMVGKGVAVLALQPMNFPETSVLTWKDAHGQERTQVLWSGGAVKPIKNEALVLEYTPSLRWKVSFEKIEYLK